MKELLVLLRAMQIYTQNAHHLVKGVVFHQDHEFFGEVYEAVGDDFDDVAERIIGLFGEEPLELGELMQGVMMKLQGAPSVGVKENKVFYQHLLGMEKQLCHLVDMICQAKPSYGTEQLVTEICNKSEMRQYKIKQRLK